MTEDEYQEFAIRISIVKLTEDEELVLGLKLVFLRYMEATGGSDPKLPAGVPASLFESFDSQGAGAMRDKLEKQLAEYEATRSKSRKMIKVLDEFKKERAQRTNPNKRSKP